MANIRRIDQATANYKEGENENAWMVSDPDGTPWWKLPQPCNERTAMAALRLARHCAAGEYDKGKKDGAGAMLAANRQRMTEMSNMINHLKSENNRLADTLERLISGKARG